MNDKFNQFFNIWNGKFCEVSDPSNLNQCMDLCYAWCDFLNIPRDTIRHLFAYEVFTQPLDITLKYFEHVPNTPAGIPPVGSLVVFSKDIGGTAGHIAISSGRGDTNNFESFDQNFGTDKHCRLVSHGYSAVLGWLTPRQEEMDDDTKRALSLLTTAKVSMGYGNLEAAVRGLVGAANDIVAARNELLEYKNGENERVKQAVDTAIAENNKIWQSQLETANKSIQELTRRVEVLTSTQAENLSYKDLFSIAFKKLWLFRKGV